MSGAMGVGDGKALGEMPLPLAGCLAALGTLTAGLAHEINNPLAAVLASLRFLAEELSEVAALLPDERMVPIFDALEDAEAGAERLRRFTRDLQALAEGAPPPAGASPGASATDVAAVIDLALALAWSGIRHRARLAREIAPVPRVAAAAAPLGQAVLALLMGAITAIPEGDAEQHEVRVRVGADGDGRVVIEVADTGPAAGRDLGLQVAGALAATLGAEFTVEHVPARGTTTRLSLRPAEAAGDDDRRPPADAAGARSIAPDRAPRRGHILVIDDDPLVLTSIRRLLAPEHDITATASAPEALRLLDGDARFDLILCDLMMPEMDGVDLHARLAARAPEQAARVLFLTGGAFTPRARRFLDEVPNPRVAKPFDGPALRSLVRALIG